MHVAQHPMPVTRNQGSRRTLLVVVLLSLGMSAPSWATPSDARADSVAVAQRRVDGLQGLARRTTIALTAGTREWEKDQALLHRLELRLRNSRLHVERAQAAVELQQTQVDGLVRQLYMQPAPSTLQAVMTRTPDQVLWALQAQSALDVVSGSQSQVIARTTTARHQLRAQEADTALLVADAARLTRRAAARLSGLQALAARTSARLVTAQDLLLRARAERAARRAAAAAAARLVVQRATRRRAAAATAVRATAASLATGILPPSATGPACTGGSTAGQANGNLDPASLCPLWSTSGERLRADAATAFNRLSRYHAASVGGPLCVTDSYRSYSEQVSVYQRKPGLAAVPGTSEHGWGRAVDLCGGAESYGTSTYRWLVANAPRYGFRHPSWAEPFGSKPEPWHWELSG